MSDPTKDAHASDQPSAKPPSVRVRRTPEQSRTLALASARRLLLSQGPDAITLQGVANDVGMSHTNLIHHFGSVAGLQSELMRQMIGELAITVEAAMTRLRAGEGEIKDFVDVVFDAFGQGGARLAMWMVLSGESQRLDAIADAVSDKNPIDDAAASSHRQVTQAALLVTLAALGDAIVGDRCRQSLGQEPQTIRNLAGSLLSQVAGSRRD